MEDSQTTFEMETLPPKPPTFESIKLPDDDALNSELLLHNVHIKQMEDNQTTIELQMDPPEADTESTNLPDDDAENPVDGIRYSTIQIIHTFTYSAEEGKLLQVNSVG